MDNFHFKIKFGEIEVEASGSEEFVKGIKEYSDTLIQSSKQKTMGATSNYLTSRIEANESNEEVKAVSHHSSSNSDNIKEESIAEFIERLPNKTHQDKILAFGFYLEKVRSMSSFGVKEINDCYDEVKEAKSNSAQYMVLLIKSGLIMRAKNSGAGGATQYILTRKGESAIKNSLGI